MGPAKEGSGCRRTDDELGDIPKSSYCSLSSRLLSDSWVPSNEMAANRVDGRQ